MSKNKSVVNRLRLHSQHKTKSNRKRVLRQGWAEMARRMTAAGDDQLLLPDFFDDEIERFATGDF